VLFFSGGISILRLLILGLALGGLGATAQGVVRPLKEQCGWPEGGAPQHQG